METLQPDFADKIDSWMGDMRKAGYNPRIVQAGRSPEYQQKLYDDYRSGRSSNVAAAPQASFHSYGRAFDWVNVGPDGTLQWNNDAAYKAGQQMAQAHGLRGLGDKDNDHLEDASFGSYRDLPASEYGRVKARGRLAQAEPVPSPAVPQGAREVQTEGGTAGIVNSTRNKDGSISTFATNFGHDTQGNPDTYDFATLGPSARFGYWGDDLFNTNLAGVAIPRETFAAHFGDPRSENNERLIADRKLAVAVRAPNGQEATLPIVDLGPGAQAKSRAGLDITGAGMRQLGLTDNANVTYRLVRL
jgi:hypothetical protein